MSKHNAEFLQCFWDLASTDKKVRLNATKTVLAYLQSSNNRDATDYALLRLVRGLASSREFARQGFSTCLCAVLNANDAMLVTEALKILDENTAITGSVKGSEERDFLFAKLFCYISIMKSKHFLVDPDLTSTAVDEKDCLTIVLLDRILLLGSLKGWLREVIAEVLLEFVTIFSSGLLMVVSETAAATTASTAVLEVLKICIQRLSPVMAEDLESMAAWQIVLQIGLQNVAASCPSFKKSLKENSDILSADKVFSMDRIGSISNTLIAATAGFPKIHRVWDSLLSQIFPMTSEREFQSKRLSSLDERQESMLTTFVQFLESRLLPGSREKRSVAWKLLVTMSALIPAEFIPTAIPRSLIRSLITARKDKKGLLYNLAGSTLNGLVSATGTDPQCRLAISSVFVQYGGANFDAVTKTSTVSSLLEGLRPDAILCHIKFLCASIAATAGSSSNNNAVAKKIAVTKKTDDELYHTEGTTSDGLEGEDEEQDAEEFEITPLSAGCASIETLHSLARNSKISDRGNVCAVVSSVLLSLACFRSCDFATLLSSSTTSSSEKSSKKAKKEKKSKKDKDGDNDIHTASIETPLPPAYERESIDCIVALTEGASADPKVFPDEICRLAGVKLLSLLAEVGSTSIHALNLGIVHQHSNGEKTKSSVPTDADESETVVKDESSSSSSSSSSTILYYLVSLLNKIVAQNTDESSLVLYNEDIDISMLKSILDGLYVLHKSSKPATPLSGQEKVEVFANPVKKHRIMDALTNLSSQCLLSTICSQATQIETVEDLVDVALKLAVHDISAAESGEMNEDGDAAANADSPLLQLLENNLELISAPSEQSIRGIREGVKKVWANISQAVGDDFSIDLIEAVIVAVVGDDGHNGEHGDHKGHSETDDDEGDSEDDEEEEEEEGEEEIKALPVSKKQKKSQQTSNQAGNENGEDDEEDIVIPESEALDLLAEDEDDGSVGDDDDVPVHSAVHDSALAHLIALKQQHRKKGILEAKRQELILRSRAIDILDAIFKRFESGFSIFPIFLPILKCFGKVQVSSSLQKLIEGKAYGNRLQTFILEKLCKKKLSLIAAGDAEHEEDIFEEFQAVSALLLKFFSSPHASLRSVASSCFLCVARAIFHGDCARAKESLKDMIKKLFDSFCNKKSKKIQVKLIEEMLITRFPNECIPVLLTDLLAGCHSAKCLYSRAELCRILDSIIKRKNKLGLQASESIESSLSEVFTSIYKTLSLMLESAKTATAAAAVDGDAADKKAVPLSWPPAKRIKPVLQCAKSLIEWVQSAVLVKKEDWVAKSSVDMLTLLRQYPAKDGKADAEDKKESKDKKGTGVTATPTPTPSVSGYSPVVAKLVDNLCTLLTPLAYPNQDTAAGAGEIKSQGKGKGKGKGADHGADTGGKIKLEATVAATGGKGSNKANEKKDKPKPKAAGASEPDRSAESKKQSNKRELEVSEDRPQSSVETAGDEKVAAKKVKKSSRKDKDAAAAVVAAVVEGDEAHHVASGSNGDCNSEKQIPDTNKKGKKRKQSSD